jgi:hypothetical protein
MHDAVMVLLELVGDGAVVERTPHPYSVCGAWLQQGHVAGPNNRWGQ